MAVNYRAIDRDVRWNLSRYEGAERGPASGGAGEGERARTDGVKGAARDRASVV